MDKNIQKYEFNITEKKYSPFWIHLLYIFKVSRHFGLDEPGKLRGTGHKGRNGAEQSSPSSRTRQYKMCTVRFQVYFRLHW